MGKFVNQNGKIRVIAIRRGPLTFFVCRKGKGIYVGFDIKQVIELAQHGFLYSGIRTNYELVNRTIKNNPILKLRDAQPDGLLIAQHPIQQKLPL